MESVFLGLRLVLVAVFAVAGVAKLFDRAGARQALEEFGLPVRFTTVGSVLLPVAELLIVVALLFAPLAGALAAIALLAVFEVAIANAVVHDRTPDCHCFGQLHSEPAGRSTLVRNGVLIVIAGIVAAFGPGPALHTWVGDRSTTELVILAALLGAAAVAASQLVARRAAGPEVGETPEGLPIGSVAPDFTLRDLEGRTQMLAALRARGRPVVLVFAHPGCGPCRTLLPGLADWQERLAARLTIAVISEGSAADNRSLRERYRIHDLLLQERSDVYRAYRFRLGTPAAVVIDPDGSIASLAVSGTQAIEELIRLALQRPDVAAPSSVVS